MNSAPSFDFIATGDFNSAFVTVTPASEAGRNFFREMFGCAGVAPVSIEMPKTKFSDFAIFAGRKGYSVA
jgi:hypothetical protein